MIDPNSDTPRAFLTDLFISHVEEVLDDPSNADGVPSWYADASATARQLDLDLDDLINSKGSDFERERLWSLIRDPETPEMAELRDELKKTKSVLQSIEAVAREVLGDSDPTPGWRHDGKFPRHDAHRLVIALVEMLQGNNPSVRHEGFEEPGEPITEEIFFGGSGSKEALRRLLTQQLRVHWLVNEVFSHNGGMQQPCMSTDDSLVYEVQMLESKRERAALMGEICAALGFKLPEELRPFYICDQCKDTGLIPGSVGKEHSFKHCAYRKAKSVLESEDE